MIQIGILQGLFGFALYLVAVALSLRIAPRVGPALLVIAVTFPIWLVALTALLSMGMRANFWTYTTSYWFFALCFLMAFGAVYKSISLRILLDLSQKPGRSDSYSSVLARYIVEESYQNRLIVIQDKRLATRTGNGFVLTQRGRRVVRLIRAVQHVFGITRSG